MKGSYQFERLEGRHTEAKFLAERARMRLEGFPDLLRRHSIPANGRILEIGCGQGVRTEQIALTFPEAKVIGLDRSPELLAEARSRQGQNAEYVEGDLYSLPFADHSFDAIYARLVFMHLERPQAALAESLRVLKPGGRILLEDADRDCMFFEPAPASFPLFWQRVQAGQRRHGGDPNVGRKLGAYLRGSGLEKLQEEVQPILGGGEEIAFLARTLLPSLNIYLPRQQRPEGEEAIRDLARLAEDPRASFYHFWFVASGSKA